MGLDPESTARATLAGMQARLVAGPHAVLGIPANATATEARSAFLELTKIYHPARFSRMSPDVQRLANEVFLGIKGAHDGLAKASGWSTRGQTGSSQPPTSVQTQRAPSPSGAFPQIPVGAAASRSYPAARPPSPSTAPTPAAAAPSGPVRTPGTGPFSRPTTPSAPPTARPGTPPPAAAPGSRPPANVVAGSRGIAPTPVRGVPIQPAPSTTPSTTPPMQAIRAAASGPVRAASPPIAAAPVSGTRPPVGAFDERAELMAVMDLVRKGQWSAARQGFQTLAARVPGSTNYKALLAYARAREAQVSGRVDEAILELQRALQLDPNLAPAKSALAELQSRRK